MTKIPHNLQWYVPDEDRRQAYIALLESCGSLDEVMQKVVNPMLLAEDIERVNPGTVGKKAFYDALEEHWGKMTGGVSYITFYRRCSQMLRDLRKTEMQQAVRHALAAKVKGHIDVTFYRSANGQGKAKIVIDIPLEEAVGLQLLSGLYDVEYREVNLRGFDGSHIAGAMLSFELQGAPSAIARTLELLPFVSEEDALENVRVHYTYRSIDRRGLTLQQTICLAGNS